MTLVSITQIEISSSLFKQKGIYYRLPIVRRTEEKPIEAEVSGLITLITRRLDLHHQGSRWPVESGHDS